MYAPEGTLTPLGCLYMPEILKNGAKFHKFEYLVYCDRKTHFFPLILTLVIVPK